MQFRSKILITKITIIHKIFEPVANVIREKFDFYFSGDFW